MAGKPDLAPTPDKSPPVLNRAPETAPNLKLVSSPLDEDRELSMADEGGASGAEMEAEEWNPEPLIAVPHFGHREPDPETDPPENSPQDSSEDSYDILKDLALFLGLIVAAGMYVSERLRQLKGTRLHRQK